MQSSRPDSPLSTQALLSDQSGTLFSYPKYWAESYGIAPYLPMSRAEMDQLGWDSCDIIIVTGDAYVDHPSFGMAVIGRFLEAQGFRVGIIAQPRWQNTADFMALGKPNLFFGITAGNMDSMINRYTADLRLRHDDAYTPNDEGGKRPDRAVIVYSQLCRQAYNDVPLVIGGIEASLRRIAQYDYWSDKIRKSVLIDSAADILLYGNAERAIAEVAHALAQGRKVGQCARHVGGKGAPLGKGRTAGIARHRTLERARQQFRRFDIPLRDRQRQRIKHTVGQSLRRWGFCHGKPAFVGHRNKAQRRGPLVSR